MKYNNYMDMFSPVIRLETAQTLALAMTKEWEIQRMDAKCAYLNGTIKRADAYI